VFNGCLLGRLSGGAQGFTPVQAGGVGTEQRTRGLAASDRSWRREAWVNPRRPHRHLKHDGSGTVTLVPVLLLLVERPTEG
jgi:hypothetical protein